MKKVFLMAGIVFMLTVCFCVPTFAVLCSGDNPGSECVYSDGASCDFCGGCIHRELSAFSAYDVSIVISDEDFDTMTATMSVSFECSFCHYVDFVAYPVNFGSSPEMLEFFLSFPRLSLNGVECFIDLDFAESPTFFDEVCTTFINGRAFVVSRDLTHVIPADFLVGGVLPSAAYTFRMDADHFPDVSYDYDVLSERLGFSVTEDSPYLFAYFLELPEAYHVPYVPYEQLVGSASILPDVTSGVASAASWVSTFATTVINTPILLISAVLAFIGFGIGIFKRIRT